jgi:hypothetical protein
MTHKTSFRFNPCTINTERSKLHNKAISIRAYIVMLLLLCRLLKDTVISCILENIPELTTVCERKELI